MTVRFDDVRDVGFFLFVAGWIVVGADILIAGLLAKNLERASHA
jgi:hypothetical protein